MFALMLLACGGEGTQDFAGTKMSDYFAFDGSRMNTYTNEDTDIDFQLIVEKKSQTELVDGRELITMEYRNGNDATVFGSVQWSSVSSESVLVHGYSLGPTGALLSFDPPVAITHDDDAMRTGDVMETSTTDSGGTPWAFTSTLVAGMGACPSTAGDFLQCLRLTIDDGDGDDTVGALFTGDFIVTTGWGAVYQTIPVWESQWELTDMEHTSSEDEE